MSARTEGLIFVVLLLVMSFIFQIQLKLFADQIAPILSRHDLGIWSKAKAVSSDVFAWRPLLIAVLAVLLFAVWFLALTKLELSVALPVASVALVINSVGSALMLGENLSSLRLAGVLTVAAGIALVLKS